MSGVSFDGDPARLLALAMPALGAAMDAAGRGIAEDARSALPPGAALGNHVRVAPGADALTCIVVADAPYARFVEFGMRNRPARPFLTGALMRARTVLLARAGQALARALADFKRTKP